MMATFDEQATYLLQKSSSTKVSKGKYSIDQLKECREAFNLFDKNGDGNIEAEELGDVMKSLGHHPTVHELNEMIQEADIDGNGSIDFNEFLLLMEKNKRQLAEDHKLKAAFQVFDLDGNGEITKSELKILMQKIGEQLTDEELDEMIREADQDGDGVINYDEFVNIILTK